MLTFDQIKEYFSPGLARINPKGMVVEYLQYELLDSLYKQAGSEKMSFIGGTAIRIIYNSQRFSEDLDFDKFGMDYNAFKDLLGKACREMELKGFELEYRFLKKGEVFHVYIKFPALLAIYGLKAHHLEKIFIAVDAEKKKEISAPEIKTLNRFGIFRSIKVNTPAVILSQKLMAILFRKRERGRDFYDVSFLSGLTRPDYSYIRAATGLPESQFKESFIKRCSGFDYKGLAREVLPFLFDAEQKDRVLNFAANISQML